MADNTTELEVLNEIVDVLGGTSGQYETVVPVLQQIKELLAAGITDPEAIAAAVAAWLDEHPEATTTVQDGSITGVKIADDTIPDTKLAQDVRDVVEAADTAIESHMYIDQQATNIFPSLTWTKGKYLAQNGGENNASTLRYSNKIAVNEGEVLSYANPNFAFRVVTAYSDETTAVADKGGSSLATYTVPAGIAYVVLSTYISYGNAEILQTVITERIAAYPKPIPMGYMNESGSLASGERLTLPRMQVKNYNRLVFNANITTFSSIKYVIGSASVEVNGTNVIITNGTGTVTTVPHGLTIGRNVTLSINTETQEYISHIRLCSDGSVYDLNSNVYAASTIQAQYVESIGSTLTECKLSWVSQNVNAPIWMFGDSYFSWYDTRWTYYLAQDGYVKNAMLNGYAGEGSALAYNVLVNLLAITTPRIIVWCLGMNDPDTSEAVNATWKDVYDKILELQKKHGFTLVLYTVPTTPTMNNNFKNAIVRDSGFRYIEADKALRIDAEGHWVGNGTEQAALSGDNVHPTTYGAKILYSRVLADLPEIMCNA